MHPLKTLSLTFALLGFQASSAWSQSLNIDYGSGIGVPSPLYGGAADQMGVWNAVSSNGPPFPLLVDVNGAPTRVKIIEQLPFGTGEFDNPDTLDDDGALMDDYLDLHSIPHTFEIRGLDPGIYTLYTYAWAPDSPSFTTVVSVGNLGTQFVGGEWLGQHQQGVTFAKHTLSVKPGTRVGIRTFGIGKGTFNGLQIVRHQAATTTPSFHPLGNLDSTAKPAGSHAFGISADGSMIVGSSYVTDGDSTQMHACRWKLNEGLKDLGVPPLSLSASVASGISNDGDVVSGAIGFVITGSLEIRNGAIWTAVNGPAKGTVLPEAFSATDVSADGSVTVGATRIPAPLPVIDQAFYRTDEEGVVELGILPGGFSSWAEAVSADGSVIVGYADTASHITAMRWTKGGGIGVIPGLPDEPGQAFGVSPDGTHIVGYVGADAFLWSAPSSVLLLGSLSSAPAIALDLSADGSVVVGQSDEAFVWDAVNGTRSLRDVLTAAGVDLSEWTLHAATGVSDDGKSICGIGTNPKGESEGFLVRLGR